MQRMAELALIYEDHTFLMVHIQAGRDTFQRALPLRKVAEGLQAESTFTSHCSLLVVVFQMFS